MSARPIVLKFGGELLENPAHLATVVSAITRMTRSVTAVGVTTERDGARESRVGVGPHACPIVICHGGGKEIDAALRVAGIEKRQVDGLRITDEATLAVVVAVLAGTVNTRLVAALTTAGVKAVGLTGVDGPCGLSAAAPPHRTAGETDGQLVDLGRVGVPLAESDVTLLTTLAGNGFVPVVATIGIGTEGQLFNVNADTLAGHLAARMGARRLVIAGTTPGVLGSDGGTLATLDASGIDRLVADRTATAGMIAKLGACQHALASGVDEVVIVDGRDGAALEAAATGAVPAGATQIAGLKACTT